MRTKICKNCGKIFDVPTGRDMHLCQECAKKAKRESVLRERTCKRCSITFVGYPRSLYCPECRDIERKEAKKRYRENGTKRPIGSIDQCESCGNSYIVNSGRQRYCPDCAEKQVAQNILKHKRQYMSDNSSRNQKLKAEVRGKRYICPICKKEFEKHSTEVTCSPECKKEYRRIKQNEADIRRGKRKMPADQRYESGLPKSGVVGVTWHRQSGKWQASYKRKYIGLYSTVEDAVKEIEKIRNADSKP